MKKVFVCVGPTPDVLPRVFSTKHAARKWIETRDGYPYHWKLWEIPINAEVH